ncbi:DUF3288 family protein [Thermosynechococcus sp. M55_K2018_012]|uniref:DUF3288 family protein n=1 Tax=Thermosynechococcus sp. M55_K2018_012 TaxID=2747809 RepID=UPI0019E895B9|nr:DUF3288 family protein [Thermosynechococcus sp. M55_K2018_012]HIK48159.1 DUF3288 family protein [Thermosynechococcus sp. M55_K2018_012]
MTNSQNLQHPREAQDQLVLERLRQEGISDYNLAELGRLLIRYDGFPGAETNKKLMAELLEKWQLTEEELFERTRAIHARGGVYKVGSNKREDWT